MNEGDTQELQLREQALAYLAGELSPEAAAAFKASLPSNPVLAEIVREERELNRALDAYLPLSPNALAMSRALAATRADLAPAPKAGRLLRFAWASGIAAALVLGAFVVFSDPVKPSEPDAPLAQVPEDSELSNVSEGFTFDELPLDEFNEVLASTTGEEAPEFLEFTAIVERLTKLHDSVERREVLQAVIDHDHETLRQVGKREGFWLEVAAKFDPLEPSAFAAAVEDYRSMLSKMQEHDERRRDHMEERRGRGDDIERPRRPDMKRGDWSPKYPEGTPALVKELAMRVLRVSPKKRGEWIDALQKRVENTDLLKLGALNERLRHYRENGSREEVLALALAGHYRAAESFWSRMSDEKLPSLAKVELEQAVAVVNKLAAAKLMGWSFKPKDAAEVTVEGMREQAMRRFHREVMGGLREAEELKATFEGLDEATRLDLFREVCEIDVAAGRFA
ncbi:MAG: hypothetical protein KDB07_07475, partial [Planctomycetes bacterium]|nr:hypothetical protein [Planctomycetota bacterium]